jgi:Uncharacterized conserved protein
MVMLQTYKGVKFWAMPFTTQEYYGEALKYMIEFSQKNNFEFIIDCAVESFIDYIRKSFQDVFLFERTPYNDDYIYEKEMLKNLTGKKMQKRRNHYNWFKNQHPNYEYRDLDLVKDFDTILNCLNKWETDHQYLSESMTSEVRGIMSLLSSQKLLEFKVGGIFIDNHIEAFIIGSKLNHSTIQIHVEKANKNMRGLYPAILKEFLEHHYMDEKYVNREEDMGLENLRKSKLALHPIKMIHKYRITLRNLYIRIANQNDTKEIQQLWLDSFQDENELSTEFYFKNYYHSQNCYLLCQNEQIISVIQISDMKISYHSIIKEYYYILGVCTRQNFQNQGCMRMLLEHVLAIYKNHNILLQAYCPQIYEPFHFHATHFHQIIEVNKEKLCKKVGVVSHDYSLMQKYYDLFTENFDFFRVRDMKYWNLMLERCHVFDDKILIFEDDGYLIYHEDSSQVYISEIIYLKECSLSKMISYFKESPKKVFVECDLKANIIGEKHNNITMMSNQFNKDILNDNYYINEFY